MNASPMLPQTHAALNETPIPAAAPGCAPATLLLVDDHEIVRCGVKSSFEELDGVPLNWLEADSLQDALQIYGREEAINAVLLDLNLADCKGLQGLRRFLQEFPEASVAVFSATRDEFVVRQARALGAAGYVPKGAAAGQVRDALKALLWPRTSGQQRYPTPPVQALFPSFPSSAMFDRVSELGAQHLEILELVLSGCTNQEISATTHLCLGTVKNYVSSLLLALDVRSRSHMVSLFR
ncbi:response regulator transcription factor [Paucibacter sp. R3-3]|uniref:Response regulator transcription factor n=1 Tax=Roseateles agri TaxID=3098619 RepID=A0ABU5DAW2_9BURK|nr:response regulator transcription factor [Paucibacter sp. R3-3]MDY0743274.1 response regulator transcription factor [Paucibacter sp. R3-3]